MPGQKRRRPRRSTASPATLPMPTVPRIVRARRAPAIATMVSPVPPGTMTPTIKATTSAAKRTSPGMLGFPIRRRLGQSLLKLGSGQTSRRQSSISAAASSLPTSNSESSFSTSGTVASSDSDEANSARRLWSGLSRTPLAAVETVDIPPHLFDPPGPESAIDLRLRFVRSLQWIYPSDSQSLDRPSAPTRAQGQPRLSDPQSFAEFGRYERSKRAGTLLP